jgi:nitrite reductase/ring-hydroxylating ferredoxin subunit
MAGDPSYWRTLPYAPAPGARLAAVGEVPDGQGREFVFGRGRNAFRMFVVRRAEAVFGYLNRCPHLSLPLNHRPERFMNSTGERIMCTQHLAIFRIEDGFCEQGACEGLWLDPVPVTVRGGAIEVAA